jgi:capsular exopolysaccharide synthesis family protein
LTKWKIYTPEGVQDILANECFFKRNLEDKIRKVFRSSGFYEVETPIVEFYDAFLAEDGITAQETMFKFFDQQGRILVLRPEITIPIARLAATKFKDVSHPLRFSYIGNTFNYKELGGGKQKEFTQAGVELLGINSPEADAEIIATAIKAVKVSGLENFQIDIGQVDFFKGLMEVINETDIEGFSFITCGIKVNNPNELIATDKFKNFIQEEVAKLYDIVIIDTPPLGSVIDAAVIAAMVDGTIIVIEANSVKCQNAIRMKDQLVKANAKILGTVLNKIKKSDYKSYYGSYDYYNSNKKYVKKWSQVIKALKRGKYD